MQELERISNQIKYSYKEIDSDILIEAIYYGTKKKIWKTILTERNFMRVVKTPNKNTTTWIHFRMVLKKVFQNKYKSTFSDDPLMNTLKIECDDDIVQKLIGKIYIELVNKKEDSISDLVKGFEDISKEESTSQKIYDYQTFSLKLVDMLKILSKEKVYMEDTLSKMENKMYKATKNKSNNEIIKALEFYYGISYTQNEVKAREKLLSSYEKGNKIAMGLLYYFGEGGLEKDYQKAVEIFLEFTKKEKIQVPHKLVERKLMGYCLFFVGKMYNEGNFLNKNYKKAIKYYERSIWYENPLAMKNLASLYDHDNSKEGIQKNIMKAIELYERAIYLGYSGAYNNLALIYHHGKENVPKNLQKAIQLYKQAVLLGNPVSLNNLAHIYHYGEDGTKIKIEKAIYLYERSILMGCTTAMINLATIYHYGQNGVSVNFKRALNLYDRSIKLGNHTCKQNYEELINKSKNYVN